MVHPTRGKGKSRSRILYWFRTPPGVRVGRGPLDEDAIRLIEAGNPELEFDWTRILKGQPAEEGREERRVSRQDMRDPGRQRERRVQPDLTRRQVRPAEPPVEALPPSEPVPPPEEPMTASHARLGSEGVARLRARYSESLARIVERVPDPDRKAELKSLAERLNPDGWVTDTDVSAGLESYESTFAELRAAIGPKRPSG